jgi:acyl-CoA thioesterase I
MRDQRLGIPSALPLLLGLAIACASANTSGPAPATEPRVVALGDSLTAGPGLRPGETYPDRLQERVRAAGLPHLVVNQGVSGDTTADALARLDRALSPSAAVLIVALGANDGLRGVPVATVRRNLQSIIERAQGRGARVLLCGMETLPDHGWQYTLDFHQLFPDLARQYDVPLMPFLIARVVLRVW